MIDGVHARCLEHSFFTYRNLNRRYILGRMIFALRCIGIEPCFERGEEDNLRILMKTRCCTRLSTKSFSKTRSLNNDALHRHCLLENSRRLAPFFSLSRSFSRQTTLVGRSIHVYVTVGHPLSVDPSLYLFSRYTLTAPLFPAIFYSVNVYLQLLTHSWSDLRSSLQRHE